MLRALCSYPLTHRSVPGREPVLAVFVQQIDLTSQFFSVNGRWCHSRLTSISFAVPGCIDPALLAPLSPYMPTGLDGIALKDPVQVPRELGRPVQDVLQQLTAESERIYRTNAPVLDTAYSVLADATRTRMMTLAQIAKTLLAKGDPAWAPSPAALLAVRKALNHNEFRFRSDARSQRLTNVFAIRPKNDVEVVETVQGWIREHREYEASFANKDGHLLRKHSKGATYIAEFVDKARRLIAISRKYRDPNPGFVGPSKMRFAITSQSSAMRTTWGEDFTSADRQIINFLQAWVLTNQFKGMPNLHSACTSILHATGCYENSIRNEGGSQPEMGRATGQLFLQEIGVISPHENRAIYDEQLMLPTVRLSRNVELLNTKAESTRRNPDFRDAMADMRRDWGSTPVYCIDSADAKEVDDGLSIERIRGGKSEFWVHVHVANPTAFFDKTHVLSGLAAHMTESVYIPERSFPMLPSWATQNYFSLDRNRPVITFSSRVDRSGHILESKIQHGIVRKVINITPAEVSAYLCENIEEEVMKLVVGGELPSLETSRSRPRLSSDQIEDLRDLYTVTGALWQARKAAGGIRLGIRDSEVRLFENSQQAGMTWNPPSLDKARHIQGDPIIEITARTRKTSVRFDIDSSNIVEEMMMLACQSAASWCAERSIPVMFRGTVEPPNTVSLEEFQKTVVFPYMEKHGSLSPSLGFRYIEALGRAIAHSSPLPHKIIGAQSYLKVTSPLRRFSDMIAHWQIEAALRYEARTGKKLNAALLANSSRPILPFSQRQMQESIITLSPRERIISQTKRRATNFWVVQAFMRAFCYKEAPLPDTFTVWVRWAKASWNTVAHLSEYPIQVQLLDAPDTTYQMGDQWEVKLHHVDLFSRIIYVAPVRLLQRDTEQL